MVAGQRSRDESGAGRYAAWAGVAVVGAVLVGCGGPAQTGGQGPVAPDEPDERKPMAVYDPSGQQQVCAKPQQDCPPVAPNREFLDACQLGGYRVLQCGCDSMCTGKVVKTFYDASGQTKACAPIDEQCTPTPVGAAYQDGCIEKGYHLSQCGCEFLCSGDPTK